MASLTGEREAVHFALRHFGHTHPPLTPISHGRTVAFAFSQLRDGVSAIGSGAPRWG